jgi:dTDP-4-dehydrorhamnose reductase
MIILISGGEGRFAKELIKQNTDHTIIPLSKHDMDITNSSSIDNAIKKYTPDVFIHAAALSRPMNIHDSNPITSIQLNIIGTSNCIISCITHNIKFVYISTDFVYPGINGNYKETDGVYPVNKYAWSKLGGECASMMYDNSLILRMAMLEYPFTHTKAFIDSFKSCIWHYDAAKLLYKLLTRDAKGIYNVGLKRNSIYNFVKRENINILEEYKNNVAETVPGDISMNIDKLNKIIDDTII